MTLSNGQVQIIIMKITEKFLMSFDQSSVVFVLFNKAPVVNGEVDSFRLLPRDSNP